MLGFRQFKSAKGVVLPSINRKGGEASKQLFGPSESPIGFSEGVRNGQSLETACLEVNVVKSLLKRARGDHKPTTKSGGKK